MIDFFVDALGAALIARKKFGTADGASLDLQGTTVNLRVAREDEKMVGDASQASYGYDHLGTAGRRCRRSVSGFEKERFYVFHGAQRPPRFEDCFFSRA